MDVKKVLIDETERKKYTKHTPRIKKKEKFSNENHSEKNIEETNPFQCQIDKIKAEYLLASVHTDLESKTNDIIMRGRPSTRAYPL